MDLLWLPFPHYLPVPAADAASCAAEDLYSLLFLSPGGVLLSLLYLVSLTNKGMGQRSHAQGLFIQIIQARPHKTSDPKSVNNR